ncbi:hypothetical protein KGA66_06145 [Actinocrinis puniceicyclus]|uniref:Lsr2 protein n=1 Tax=Actinocrinis puniceicyclus TaxID=977794 RepID=A0A8J8BBM3_9ACTN|nr:hypothetical protein [Actinocrinis puniceicyclus]MBS2962620.1 hypothetical protein [Actinocrinis puniceicyclus]
MTPAQAAGRCASTRSPFGLMGDLGAAVAAEIGMPLIRIARHLGPGVSDATARAAIVRGRQELVARRVAPASFRGSSPPVPPAPARPASPAPSAAPYTLEQLLAWGQTGPQRARSIAAKAQAILDELAELQQQGMRRQQHRRERRAHAIPPEYTTAAQRRVFFQKVRAWAQAHGCAVPEGRIVPTSTVIAYQMAQRAQIAAGLAALDEAAEPG